MVEDKVVVRWVLLGILVLALTLSTPMENTDTFAFEGVGEKATTSITTTLPEQLSDALASPLDWVFANPLFTILIIAGVWLFFWTFQKPQIKR